MPNEISQEALLAAIEDATGCTCEAYDGITDEVAVRIPADQLHAVIGLLRDQFECTHLSAITAQQRESRPGEIELIYHFWQQTGISVMLTTPRDSPQVASVISLIPGADFYEREVAEMFGIIFTGREETRNLLLPDEWNQGPPFIRNEEANE